MGRLLVVVAVVVVAAAAAASPIAVDLSGVARAAGKPVEDAVIWLEAPEALRTAKPSGGVLSQRDLQFAPHVLVVQVGTHVRFPNQDRVFHNVFSFHDGKKFDLGLYPVGVSREVPFDRPGLSRIFCNIHPQMAAYVVAVDSPFFAASDRSGRFTISGVPPQAYRYHAWRAGGDVLTGDIDAGGDEPFVVTWP